AKIKKALNIHQNTVYKKDTNTFKKIETVDSSLDEFMDDFLSRAQCFNEEIGR
ncbi:hypothetical protein AAULH_14516, partial [Lactobacillus helveticus MTCC 5463]